MPDPVLTPIPYADFVEDVARLADAIAADTAWRARYIVGIGRGGLAPAVYLSHATGYPMLSLDLSTRGVPAFADALVAALAGQAAGGDDLLFV
ncbi:MAG: phosphoribosyltransferase, partial [Sphingomonas sp.]